ncbi:sugar MFS transporter [Roseivirga sp. BDSF3-8]|uniref:MFS transporter n=1 Tax=Roseivirga sp. BDSF3-8 TaxID=3241598 RepID=UPI0035327C65
MLSSQRSKLFFASCLALLVTSLSFGIRAGLLNQWEAEFQLSGVQLANIAATAFWSFPLAVIIGGMLVDAIGMKKILMLAFFFHLVGIVMTIFSTGYWTLFISTLLIGIANGTVEAACNPLVASLYPDNKTTKLNHFHLWFPAGIVIGSLVVFFFNKLGIGWQWQMAVMILPTLAYGHLFFYQELPVTERVAIGVSSREMYRSLLNPLFIFMVICMFGTAITELFVNQWSPLLLSNVTENPILLLMLTTGVMVIGRGLAGPVAKKISTTGMLLASAIISFLGLYLIANTTGAAIFAGALVFGIGVCYFWPTMIGFVAEYLPRTGAVGISLIGGAGMFAVSIYTMFMGGFYDRLVLTRLPAGANLDIYKNAQEGTEMATQYLAARSAAGPEVLNATLIIPGILILAFAGLFVYMRTVYRRKDASKENPIQV